MRPRIKNLLAIVFLGMMLILPSATVQAAGACGGFGDAFIIRSAKDTPNAVGALPAFCTAASVATFAINLLLGLSGAVAVVFLMLGGFWYLTAAGNEEMAEKGRKALTNSVIGLVIIIMSFALVRIAINLLTTSTGGGSGTPPATTSANPPAGTVPPVNPGVGTTGNPVTSNQSSIFFKLTQQDISNYDNVDHLGQAIIFDLKFQGVGVTVSSTLSDGDKQSLAQLRAGCPSGDAATLKVTLNGTDFGSANFTSSGGGVWQATVDSSTQLKSGDALSAYLCNSFVKIYTVPAGIAPR